MVDDQGAQEELQDLRNSIDNIDAAMIYMLAERFRCTQRVGALKAHHHLPPADPAREEFQVARLRRLAGSARLDPEFAEKDPSIHHPRGDPPSRAVRAQSGQLTGTRREGQGRHAAARRRLDNPLRGVVLLVVATVFFSVSDMIAKYLTRSLPATEIRVAPLCRLRRAGGVVDCGLVPGLSTSGDRCCRFCAGSALSVRRFFSWRPSGACQSPRRPRSATCRRALITILSVPVLSEVVGLRRWAAVVVGLFGVLLVVRPGTAAFQPAALFPVLSALCWATASVVTRKISRCVVLG